MVISRTVRFPDILPPGSAGARHALHLTGTPLFAFIWFHARPCAGKMVPLVYSPMGIIIADIRLPQQFGVFAFLPRRFLAVVLALMRSAFCHLMLYRLFFLPGRQSAPNRHSLFHHFAPTPLSLAGLLRLRASHPILGAPFSASPFDDHRHLFCFWNLFARKFSPDCALPSDGDRNWRRSIAFGPCFPLRQTQQCAYELGLFLLFRTSDCRRLSSLRYSCST